MDTYRLPHKYKKKLFTFQLETDVGTIPLEKNDTE